MKIKIFSIVLLITVCLPVYSQIATTLYSSRSFTKIAVGYEFSDKTWCDLRAYSGFFIENFTFEPVIAYNFVSKDAYDVYSGVGCIINLKNFVSNHSYNIFSSYVVDFSTGPIIPIGVRLRPFEKSKNLQIIMEAQPTYIIESNKFAFLCSIGLRYVFRD